MLMDFGKFGKQKEIIRFEVEEEEECLVRVQTEEGRFS